MWSLEQTKYFTKGCQDLLVVTDHKPLVKLFTDRMLDEISNPRLFSLRQRTLQWRFDVQYMPGKGNCFSDATSRHPIDFPENEVSVSPPLMYLNVSELSMKAMRIWMQPSATFAVRAVTWDVVKEETRKDLHLSVLTHMLFSGFPSDKEKMSSQLQLYWKLRKYLSLR